MIAGTLMSLLKTADKQLGVSYFLTFLLQYSFIVYSLSIYHMLSIVLGVRNIVMSKWRHSELTD